MIKRILFPSENTKEMNKRTIIFLFLLICLPLAGLLFNWLYLQPAILAAYKGSPDEFLQFIIHTLYPRFEIEKSRFEPGFFLTKADQVIYRSCFIYYTILILTFLSKQKDSFAKKISQVFYSETSLNSIDLLRYLFFSYSIYLSLELCHDLILLQPMTIFYKPILWLRIIPLPFPGPFAIFVLAGLWVLTQVLILLNIRIVLCSFITLFLFLLVQCWLFSFEKLDHGYVTFTYALMAYKNRHRHDLFPEWSGKNIYIKIFLVES